MQKICFANRKAEMAWKTLRDVRRAAERLGPENPYMKFHSVSFPRRSRTRGTYAILFAGTVVGTSRLGTFIVPERTLQILKTLHISSQSQSQ
jgi:hypothetical protein